MLGIQTARSRAEVSLDSFLVNFTFVSIAFLFLVAYYDPTLWIWWAFAFAMGFAVGETLAFVASRLGFKWVAAGLIWLGWVCSWVGLVLCIVALVRRR
jgi:hypothetical protein